MLCIWNIELKGQTLETLAANWIHTDPYHDFASKPTIDSKQLLDHSKEPTIPKSLSIELELKPFYWSSKAPESEPPDTIRYTIGLFHKYYFCDVVEK